MRSFFTIASRATYNGSNVIANMSFICFLFLNCRFSNKYAFHVHVIVQASSENVIVIVLFIRLLAWKLCCHFLVYEEPFHF